MNFDRKIVSFEWFRISSGTSVLSYG